MNDDNDDLTHAFALSGFANNVMELTTPEIDACDIESVGAVDVV